MIESALVSCILRCAHNLKLKQNTLLVRELVDEADEVAFSNNFPGSFASGE